MTKEDFNNIQAGQKVVFTGWVQDAPEDILTISKGDTLVRKKDWLDCEKCIRFDKEDGSDYHWFYADEIELIGELA